MITVEEALRIIKTKMPDWGVSTTTLEELGMDEVSENLICDRDYPPFHRVMMDGIAVSYNVFKEGKTSFKIAGVCPAGVPQAKLVDNSSCFEVMTGAPLPEGTDLVIPYEHLNIVDGVAAITHAQDRTHLENVHLRGSDSRAGDTLLKAGETLNGPHWGIAASLGYGRIAVKRKPRICVISTGDELVDVVSTPLPHQIRRSNAYALKASLKLHGFEDVALAHLPDEVRAIEEHYRSHSQDFDLLIYSGGVSKGKFDYLPSTWKSLGIEEHFHGISQRPGKPLWFGTNAQEKKAILGLPGNPVSSLVCLHRYFLSQKAVYAQLTEEIVFKKDLTSFIPVKLSSSKEGVLKATPLKMKNSGEFSALAGSDGFLELPKEQNVFKAGEAFLFHSWRPQ